jgi:hypothetical protein
MISWNRISAGIFCSDCPIQRFSGNIRNNALLKASKIRLYHVVFPLDLHMTNFPEPMSGAAVVLTSLLATGATTHCTTGVQPFKSAGRRGKYEAHCGPALCFVTQYYELDYTMYN